MIDILQYKPVIQKVLSDLKVPKNLREDREQDCYVALLERNQHLEHGEKIGKGTNYAAMICHGKLRDIRIAEQQYSPNKSLKPDVRFESLSDPRVYSKAAKVPIPETKSSRNVTTWELEDAMLSLPFDQYRVIYSIFVEEKTGKKTADDLGMTVGQVWFLKEKGVQSLKKYFGEEDGA